MFWSSLTNIDKIASKILEFNNQMDKNLQLNNDEAGHLNSLVIVLSDSTNYASNQILDIQFDILHKLILSWAFQKLFPVFDLFRLVIFHPSAVKYYNDLSHSSVFEVLIKRISEDDPTDNSRLVALRVLANLFKELKESALRLLDIEDNLFKAIKPIIQTPKKTVQISLVYLIFNYAILVKKSDHLDLILDTLQEMITIPQDEESIYRILVILGTIYMKHKFKELSQYYKLAQQHQPAMISDRCKEIIKDLPK